MSPALPTTPASAKQAVAKGSFKKIINTNVVKSVFAKAARARKSVMSQGIMWSLLSSSIAQVACTSQGHAWNILA